MFLKDVISAFSSSSSSSWERKIRHRIQSVRMDEATPPHQRVSQFISMTTSAVCGALTTQKRNTNAIVSVFEQIHTEIALCTPRRERHHSCYM
jgi:hypothetical protein